MNNQRLPAYPEHREPDERHESAEYERESRPRISPGAIAWMGLALIVAIYFGQEFAAKYLGGDKLKPAVTAPAKPGGN